MSMLHKPMGAGYVPRFQKTYLSREMSRAMALDHPIGDPHGGPAYGERNDPVSAIISIGTLIATGGAVVAGTATLMTGLAFAGAAISLVGNVTGNKTLSKIGMITGLAGGAGMLAESAGLFASGTMGETFGYGAQAAGAGAPTGVDAAALSQTPDVTPQVVDAGAPSVAENIVNAPSSVAPSVAENLPQTGLNGSPVSPSPASANLAGTPSTDLVSPAASQTQGLVNNAAGGALSSTPAGTSVAAPTAPGAPGVTDSMLSTANASTDPIGSIWQQTGGAVDPSYAGNIRPMTGMENAWQGIKSIGSGFMDLAKSNPGAAYMMGQAISSAGDVFSGKAGAQIDALEAQGDLSRAQAEKLRFDIDQYKRRLQNLNTNYTTVQNPLATWKPNFQTQPVQSGGGLIGGAMQPAPTPGG